MRTASLAQVPTTLLIYYGQGDRVAGVTLPWAREETPQAVSLLLLRPNGKWEHITSSWGPERVV